MPPTEPFVLLTIVVGLTACAWYQWRRGVRSRWLLAALWSSLYGLALVAMMAAHCAEITFNTIIGSPGIDGSLFSYNWRTYSLLLFGALLIWQGAVCLGTAGRLGRGEAAARATTLRAVALVLAVVLPIIPIHAFFGYLISGLSALTLVVVAAAARARTAPASQPRHSPLPRPDEALRPTAASM